MDEHYRQQRREDMTRVVLEALKGYVPATGITFTGTIHVVIHHLSIGEAAERFSSFMSQPQNGHDQVSA